MAEDLELKVGVPADAREKSAGYAFLGGVSKRLEGRLRQDMQARWPDAKVKADTVEDDADEFSIEIAVRRGLRVGAEVDVKWEPGDTEAEVETTTFSLLQTILGVGLVLVCGGACAVATLADVPPFDQIPGRKIGALIGFFIGAIPGFIGFLILSPILMSGAGEDNEALLEAVNGVVSAELAAFAAEQGASPAAAAPGAEEAS